MSANCACGNTHHPSVPTPVNYDEMQAVTTIINPATVGKEEEKVLVYQSLKKNGTLGYEQLPSHKTELKAQSLGNVVGNYDENPSPLTPVLKWKSNLVSLVINDIVSNCLTSSSYFWNIDRPRSMFTVFPPILELSPS